MGTYNRGQQLTDSQCLTGIPESLLPERHQGVPAHLAVPCVPALAAEGDRRGPRLRHRRLPPGVLLQPLLRRHHPRQDSREVRHWRLARHGLALRPLLRHLLDLAADSPARHEATSRPVSAWTSKSLSSRKVNASFVYNKTSLN